MSKRFLTILSIIFILLLASTFILYKKSNHKDTKSNKNSSNSQVVQQVNSSSSSKEEIPTISESMVNNLNFNSTSTHNSVDEINSLSNYLNGGFISYNNPYLFISPSISISNDTPLSFSLEDGTTLFKKTGILDAVSLTPVDNYLFYKTSSSPTLTKTNIPQAADTILLHQCGCYFIYNDWIYYMDLSDGAIKKIPVDGGSDGGSIITIKTNLFKYDSALQNNESNIFIYNNKIYLSTLLPYGDGNYQDWKRSLYSMNLDGTNSTKILEDYYWSFTIYNNFIYYIKVPNATEDNKVRIFQLVRVDMSTQKNTILLEGPYISPNAINIYKDDLYFFSLSNTSDLKSHITLQKYNLNTKKVIAASSSLNTDGKLFILNDRIFVMPLGMTDRNPYLYYSIKTDGSEEKYVK